MASQVSQVSQVPQVPQLPKIHHYTCDGCAEPITKTDGAFSIGLKGKMCLHACSKECKLVVLDLTGNLHLLIKGVVLPDYEIKPLLSVEDKSEMPSQQVINKLLVDCKTIFGVNSQKPSRYGIPYAMYITYTSWLTVFSLDS
jgi:hypothetical protein